MIDGILFGHCDWQVMPTNQQCFCQDVSVHPSSITNFYVIFFFLLDLATEKLQIYQGGVIKIKLSLFSIHSLRYFSTKILKMNLLSSVFVVLFLYVLPSPSSALGEVSFINQIWIYFS